MPTQGPSSYPPRSVCSHSGVARPTSAAACARPPLCGVQVGDGVPLYRGFCHLMSRDTREGDGAETIRGRCRRHTISRTSWISMVSRPSLYGS
jgi:hypothetical protein